MEVRAYLANQFGFSETGRYILDSMIKPRIRKIGLTILDPFEACGLKIDWSYLKTLKRHEDAVKFWMDFSQQVTVINNGLMRNSHCLLAILDGGPAVDDGVASEIGYYAGIRQGPIFALRSDFRLGENIAVTVNPQLFGYIYGSGGQLIDRENAVERWFDAIKNWYESFKSLKK